MLEKDGTPVPAGGDKAAPASVDKVAPASQEPQAEAAKKPQDSVLLFGQEIMKEFDERLKNLDVSHNLGRDPAGSPLWQNAENPLAALGLAHSLEAAAVSAPLKSGVGRVEGQSQVYQAGALVIQNIYGLTVNGEMVRRFRADEALGADGQNTQAFQGTGEGVADRAMDSPGEKILEEIQSGSSGSAYVISSRDTPGAGKIKLPDSYEEIEQWYTRLSENERCLVKAAAVLHNSPVSAISRATSELYTQTRARSQASLPPQVSVQPETEKSADPATTTETLTRFLLWLRQEEQGLTAQAVNQPSVASPPSTTALVVSNTEMLNRAHLYIRRVNGAMRLFWEDADEASGISSFSTKLLRFFAREADLERMFAWEAESFLDIVKQWPEKYRGELSWRSANALGVIWWYQNARELLWTQASEWAKSDRPQAWEHAAALLDGAFRVEQNEIRDSSAQVVSSSVIQLLYQWINVAHQATNKRGEGYAAARAYALIGRKYPEVALKGLQRLLVFPVNKPEKELKPEVALQKAHLQQDLIIKGVFKYIDIIKSGHIRPVLAHLANSLHQPLFTSMDSGQNRIQTQTQQGTNDLQVILAAFMLVVNCSLSGANLQANPSYNSTQALPELPICPSREDKDVLLAGILTEAEQPMWRQQVAMLVGALLMEKADEAAFYVLRRWAEIVLRDTGPEARALRQAYQHFLVQIGWQLHAWLSESRSQRFFALRIYQRKLRQWTTDKRLSPHHKFRQLAEQVLMQLDNLP